METDLTHAFQVSMLGSGSGHLCSLSLLWNPQFLLLLVEDEMRAELALCLVESLHLYLHEPKTPTDECEVDTSLGAKHDFIPSSCHQDHGDVSCHKSYKQG